VNDEVKLIKEKEKSSAVADNTESVSGLLHYLSSFLIVIHVIITSSQPMLFVDVHFLSQQHRPFAARCHLALLQHKRCRF